MFHSRDIIFNEVSVPRIEKEQKSDGGKCVELETESVTDDFPLPTLKILIQKLLEWRLILKVITQQKSLREKKLTPLVRWYNGKLESGIKQIGMVIPLLVLVNNKIHLLW